VATALNSWILVRLHKVKQAFQTVQISTGADRPPHFRLFNFSVLVFNEAMITRYSRPEMRAIWTDENKLKIWLQIELLASEALVKEKIVPAKTSPRSSPAATSGLPTCPALSPASANWKRF